MFLFTALGTSVRTRRQRAARVCDHVCCKSFRASDAWNYGNPLVGWLDAALGALDPIHSGLSTANSHCGKISEEGLAVA